MRRTSPSSELALLIQRIARASLVSGALAGCSEETARPPDGGASGDAAVGVDAGPDAGGDPHGDAATGGDGGGPLPPGSDAGGAGDGGAAGDYVPLACADGRLVLPETPSFPASATPAAVFVLGISQLEPYVYEEAVRYGPHSCARDDSACIGGEAAAVRARCVGDAQSPCEAALVLGSGSAATILTTREEVLRTLGSIDSLAEAVLLAAFDGYPMRCASESITSTLSLSGTGAYESDAGFELRTEWEDCWDGAYRDRVTVARDGTVSEREHTELLPVSCVIGRLPPGYAPRVSAPARGSCAGYLGEAAELEAAAVHAFRQLERELSALGAPLELVARVRAALVDEVRHTDHVARLARARGARPRAPRVLPRPPRSRLELALDNTREGCVRETFGALIARVQADTAADPELRAAMASIACDELRHAELSWALAAWLDAQLTPSERAEVRAARDEAVHRLAGELDLGLEAEAARQLGMPTPAAARELFEGMRTALWAA